MGIRSRPNSTAEPEDDADTDTTIPSTISNLKTAFTSADFARAERALLAGESTLKREIEHLKKENAKLLEASHFHELEMLQVKREARGVMLEQGRRIGELERQKLKLEGLVVSEYEGWKGLLSKLEGKLSGGGKERSGGVVVKLEKEEVVEGEEIGGVSWGVARSVFGVKDSGIRKFPSEDAVLIERHHECAPKDTEMLCEKSEIQKETESLGLIGVQCKPGVPKRKLVLSGRDDDENWVGKCKEDKNLKMKHQKLKLEPDCPLINNHHTETLHFSGSKVFNNQNLPNHGKVNLRESEEKIMVEHKAQVSPNAPVEVSSDSDSSSCSSSSSDSEDDNLLLSQLMLFCQKSKQEREAVLSNEPRRSCS